MGLSNRPDSTVTGVRCAGRRWLREHDGTRARSECNPRKGSGVLEDAR